MPKTIEQIKAIEKICREKEEFDKVRHEQTQLCVKSNTLVRNLQADLTKQEQTLILYLISKIRQGENELKVVEIQKNQYQHICKILGITYCGKNQKDIIQALKNLHEKKCVLIDENKKIYFHWLGTFEEDTNTGLIRIAFDDILRPYLLNLYNNFTAFQLENILTMDSKFSSRLYELFISYKSMKKFEITVNELKQFLGIENKYDAFKELKRNVIDIAINEINLYTDINCDFELLKVGKSVNSIIFYINEKSEEEKTRAFDERFNILLTD